MSIAPFLQSFHLLKRQWESIQYEPHRVSGDHKVHGMNRVVPLQPNRVEQ
jgi:hypothetical protein